jgi:S-DNA-T family DNA segregation ATPase FtsK/SpoIIIE
MTNDPTRDDGAQGEPDKEQISSEFNGIMAADPSLWAMSFIDTDNPDDVPDFDLLSDEDAPRDAASADVVETGDPAAAVAPPPVQRVQVLPVWARQGRGVLPWLGGRTLDAGAAGLFHVVRSPWYALRGLHGLVMGAGRWVVRPEDAEQFAVDMKRAGSTEARRQLRAQRRAGRFFRFAVAVAPLCAVWSWVEYGRWGILPAAVAAGSYMGLAVVGWRSLRAARSPRERQVRARRVPVLSRPFVTEALDMIDCGTVKRPTGEAVGPVILSSSPVPGGELMEIDLAPSVPVSKLLKRQEEFAGALGRPAECVVIETMPDVSPQRFELFVSAKVLSKRKAPAWAGSKVKRRSFFDGVPVGVDARGRVVVVPLFEAHGLIGGYTGMGKTFSARLLLLWAAMDPRCTILIHNFKGGPDYRAFAPVAHTLRSGCSAADLEAFAADLAWLRSEIARRGRVFEGLSSSTMPDGKLTEEVASMPGMGPVILLVDEPQRAFASKRGKELAREAEDVVRTARAVGFNVQLVTQGTKEGAIPSGITDQLPRRIGHGMTNITDANMILGSDAHGRTYRAVDIDTPGIAYVGQAGGAMVKTIMAKVDLPKAERIVEAAAELRREAGTLTGMAAGEVPADEHDGGTGAFLADLLTVWPADEAGKPRRNAGSAELAGLLAAHDAGEYGDMEGAVVSRRMKGAGVKVSTQRLPREVAESGSAQGVKRADVVRAAGGAASA